MQLGMVGLGRMGGNMTVRLAQAGHDVKTFDPKVDSTSSSLEELAGQRAALRLADGPGWDRRLHRL